MVGHVDLHGDDVDASQQQFADVLLVDCGLTEEAAALAERLARRREDLKLCNTEEICQWMQTPIQ